MAKFADIFDTVDVINRPARDGKGEDNCYCAKCSRSAIISVCDGCGGLGARKYPALMDHTGAYIASRAVSGAIHDWYHENSKKEWQTAEELAEAIDVYIRRSFDVCNSYAADNKRIGGSMVRKFPTTLASAYAEKSSYGVRVHVMWAGDSRVYLLDQDGLAQLTVDDTDERDAYLNLTADSPMTNVLSADGNYEIHRKTIEIGQPTIIFAATDGCFGYIPSPMEFEYEIVKNLVQAKNPKAFKKNLKAILDECAGDDLLMGYMSFYFSDYSNTKRIFAGRLKELQENYISRIHEEDSDECREALWQKYKPGYERLMD